MKVQYEKFDKSGYEEACAIREDLYPHDPAPTVEEYTNVGTGEIVSLIKSKFFDTDVFLIADDKTNEFIRVPISRCKRILKQTGRTDYEYVCIDDINFCPYNSICHTEMYFTWRSNTQKRRELFCKRKEKDSNRP